MSAALRSFVIELRAGGTTRGARASAAALFACGAVCGLRGEGAEARGTLAYGLVPLLAALLCVGVPLARARSSRTGALDLQRLHGGGAGARSAAYVAARGLLFALALGAAVLPLELTLGARSRSGSAPRWTERPFAQVARQRLERLGAACALPAFACGAEANLIVPLRWRGDPADPVRLGVLLRAPGAEQAEERELMVSGSAPLRIALGARAACEALFVHRGGSGELRLDLADARLEGAVASPASAALALFSRALLLGGALVAAAAGLAAWLRPALALALLAALAPLLLFDPLSLAGKTTPFRPDASALLGAGAWAAGEPRPFAPRSALPFALLGALGLVAAALGEHRRSAP